MARHRKAAAATPDRENPAFTPADFKKAKRVEDIAALAHLSKRKRGERGPQKAPVKQPVSLRLDAAIVKYYRDQGPGWQAQINNALLQDVIVRRHGNTRVAALRKVYGSDFASGVSGKAKLSDVLANVDEPSLRKLRA